MARIPRSFARRARSTASIFLGTPSGSECVCISIAPLRVCAFADNEKTRNIAASCDLMDVPFIEQASLELGVDPDQDAGLFRDAVRRKQSAAVARGEISHERSRAPRIGRNRNQRGGVVRVVLSLGRQRADEPNPLVAV